MAFDLQMLADNAILTLADGEPGRAARRGALMPADPPALDRGRPGLHARLGAAIDPDRKVLAALERIVPLSGKRIADVGTGIGHYPMLLARRTGRTYGIEADPELLAEARRRAAEAHQPNIRIVEGDPTELPLRDGAVDVVLTSRIDPDDQSLPAIEEALRVIRPGGRLIAIGYYGRDDVAPCSSPRSSPPSMEATQRRTGWWLRNGFKIKVVHARVDLGDPSSPTSSCRASTATAGAPTSWGRTGLAAAEPRPLPPRPSRPPPENRWPEAAADDEIVVRKQPCGRGTAWISSIGPKARLFSPPEPGLRRSRGRIG